MEKERNTEILDPLLQNQSSNFPGAGKWIGKKAEVVSFDKVTPTEIDWLWPNHIPLGMLTLIAGDPGVGKSFLTLYMASIVSSGQGWPEETSILDTRCLMLDA